MFLEKARHFLKKMKRRIFKDKRHVGIYLYPTLQCDTGCEHCLSSSNCKNIVNFPKEMAESIIKESRKERWKLSVLLTGGGEPLLNPEIVQITDLFGNYERLKNFSMMTSGFLNSEIERKQRFETLLKRPYAKRLWIDQSFHLYHKSFPDRLANTARLLMKIKEKSQFCIKTCMSLENHQETRQDIEIILKDLAKNIGAKFVYAPVGFYGEANRLHVFENKRIDNASAHMIGLETSMVKQWYAMVSEKNIVAMFVDPCSLDKIGRGKNIKETSYTIATCLSLYSNHDNISTLLIEPDGWVYPDTGCSPSKHMRLGKIGEDSLVELVRRKDVFSEHIMREILADNRMFEWKEAEGICELCKKIVAEKGILFQGLKTLKIERA